MPAKPDDRVTLTLGAALIQALRERAEAERRTPGAVVADALGAYLGAPPRPAEAALPGLAPVAPGLQAQVQALVAVLHQMLPRVAKAADGHDEIMDVLDEIMIELGRREGAALALEKVAALDRGEQS